MNRIPQGLFPRVAAIAMAMALGCFDAVAQAAATSGTIELNSVRSGDCTGEDVQLSGRIHLVSQTQPDGSVIGSFNYQNATGTGLASGATYRAVTVDRFRLGLPFPSSISSTAVFQLVGRGTQANLWVKVLYHITVNAEGQVTATIDDTRITCH